MKVKDKVFYDGKEWIIIRIWDTNHEGLRADLIRKNLDKRSKIERCSVQLSELEKYNG